VQVLGPAALRETDVRPIVAEIRIDEGGG